MPLRATTWVLFVVMVLAVTASGRRARADAGDIDSVVVFADRARVTRTRPARCEQGKARALFDRLPPALDARTLRGDVREPAEVIGVTSDAVSVERAVDARVRALIDEQRRIAADIRDAEAKKGALAAELDDVGAYTGLFSATVAEEVRNPKPDTATWEKTLDALRARRARADARGRELDVALRALHLSEDRVGRQLAALGGVGDAARAYRTAAVSVDCHALDEVTVILSYVVPGATWQPEYDLDFTPRGRGAKVGAGTARLTVGAVVRQASGEDWRDVKLALSTARPRLGAEAPLPAPLVIDGCEQRRDKVLVQAQERREQIAAGGTGGEPPRGPSAATLDDKGNAFVLTLPHRVTVAADGRPVWSPVDVVQAEAAAKLVAVPKLDEHVYQIVALKNPAAYPLLEGRVRSYRGGSYVGDAQLRYRGVGEPLEVSLGIDDELKVERKVMDAQEKDPTFLSSTKRIVHTFRIALANRAVGTEVVELRESIPVSKNDAVRVELLDKRTSPGYALDRERGFITWSVPLESGEQRSVDLGYGIRLPESWQMQ
jgi:uncharacterized protein (TIGR02231 family)